MSGLNIIEGRPDFGNCNFGITEAKTFPPYVYSSSMLGLLIYKVHTINMCWWKAEFDHMVRLDRPWMYAETVCGMTKFLEKGRSITCWVPRRDAILCGRCHGEVASFGKNGKCTKAGMKRGEAHLKLGCIVKGY